MRYLLIAAFVLSGAAGLVYESIWSRYIGLFVGHSAYAQVIVLAVFLGGMALGAAWIGKRSETIRQPLVWYAIVELGVAVGGFAFHPIFRFVTSLAYDAVFPAVGGATLQIAKWGLAALLILPQSILLGATFPLMSAGVIRMERSRGGDTNSSGRTLSILYFANSIGAAAGVLAAGFLLVNAVGLPGTLAAAGFINLLAAAMVFVSAGWLNAEERAPAPAEQPASPALEGRDPVAVYRALLIVACGTAIASFVYEITWVRLLSLVLGSATHSFELMLSSFILGLALGALWIRGRADRLRDPIRTLAIVQWVMGALALATIPFYLNSFDWAAWWLSALARNENGYALFGMVRYGICLVIMLPATFCAGMTLPLITRTAMAVGGGERAIGRIYSINTFGSIIGAALGGLVLIPMLQLKGTLVLGAIIDMMLGIYLTARFLAGNLQGRRLLLITTAGGTVVVANVLIMQQFDRGVLTSGVYRYASVPEKGSRKIAFYRDGRTATVSVRGDGDDGYSLATNGKPDASLTREWLQPLPPSAPRTRIGGDQVTQAFLPLITLAHAPEAKTAAVIGFGSGVSSHMLLGSPKLQQLVTVEIEPAMVAGSRLFGAANRRVYQDRRSQIVIDDAKSYFASANKRFDLIMSEPSNPWVSGVSGLFTDEFYSRVKRYLADDGVFGQWLHLYEIDDDLVAFVIAAIHRNFPAYEIFFTSSVDVLIVATPAKHLREPDWNVVSYPGISEDLTRFRQLHPETFEGLRVVNRDVLASFIESGVPENSDFHPYLDLRAEATRFDRSQASAFIGLGADRFPLGLVLEGRRMNFVTDTVSPIQIQRSDNLALGAALRAGSVPPDTGAEGDELRRARHRLVTLRALMAAGPPPNWQLWLRDVFAVDADIHNGTAGVADERFFNELYAYMAKYHASPRMTLPIHFVHAVSVWDWTAADTLGEQLIQLGRQPGGLPVGGDIVRDGLVVARLRLGDTAGARRAFEILITHGTRSRNDIRNRILYAWIQRAEAQVKQSSAPESQKQSQ